MKIYVNRLMLIRSFYPPKLWSFGANMGPADPMVRLAQEWPLAQPFVLDTAGGPPTCVCQCRGFVRQFSMSNGPLLDV